MDLSSLFLDKTVVILVIVAASAGIRPITGNQYQVLKTNILISMFVYYHIISFYAVLNCYYVIV